MEVPEWLLTHKNTNSGGRLVEYPEAESVVTCEYTPLSHDQIVNSAVEAV